MNFKFASDGSGGTIAYDSPVPAACNFTGKFPDRGAVDRFEGAAGGFSASMTLGYWRNSSQTGATLSSADASQCALLRSYIASSFVTAQEGYCGMTTPSDPQLGSQSVLANPHHG